MNAADAYLRQYVKERAWARKSRGGFGIFMSSSTDPFVPQEDRFRITRSVLEAMMGKPPDFLIVQTHTHRVTNYIDLYPELSKKCRLRFHISLESDRDTLPGLPPPASSVEDRFRAAAALQSSGFRVVITVSPLLPIGNPDDFFARIATVADAVVIDHFIQGDGTPQGTRTLNTSLPEAMKQVDPESTHLSYRHMIVEVARQVMPGRVGVGVDGFAGRLIEPGLRKESFWTQ